MRSREGGGNTDRREHERRGHRAVDAWSQSEGVLLEAPLAMFCRLQHALLPYQANTLRSLCIGSTCGCVETAPLDMGRANFLMLAIFSFVCQEGEPRRWGHSSEADDVKPSCVQYWLKQLQLHLSYLFSDGERRYRTQPCSATPLLRRASPLNTIPALCRSQMEGSASCR